MIARQANPHGEESDTESSFKKCMTYCFPCTLILIIVGLLASSIAYVVFSAIGLRDTSYKELREMCPDTNLWIYLLITLILGSGTHLQTAKLSLEDDINVIGLICGIIAQLGFVGWGAYELWGVDCVDEIKSNLIYTMVYINIIVSIVIIGVICMLALIK